MLASLPGSPPTSTHENAREKRDEGPYNVYISYDDRRCVDASFSSLLLYNAEKGVVSM